MKKILFGLATTTWILATSLLWYSCVSAEDYTDRQVGRAVEWLISRGEWQQRKPLLQKLDTVLPVAKEKFAWRQSAIKILDQIQKAVTKKLSICISEIPEQAFSKSNLATNTSIRSIPLDEVLSGWPPKDGIPALSDPKFVDIATANQWGYLNDASEGIVVSDGDDSRFYPFQILNRHEIINDTVGNKNIAITFCPLCGTAITFSREFDGEVINFWVSGKLHNSNLLMYDDRTDSLWSQAMGRWVVGFYTDFQLEYVDSDVITYSKFVDSYPNGKVLSDDTWYDRNYKLNSPYGDYNTNDDLFFPVENLDTSLPKKKMLYVVNDTKNELSIAFVQEDLAMTGRATIIADGISYNAMYTNGKVQVVRGTDGTVLSHFTQMRFSWTAHDYYPRYLWNAE